MRRGDLREQPSLLIAHSARVARVEAKSARDRTDRLRVAVGFAYLWQEDEGA